MHSNKELRSFLKENGQLELSLTEVPVPEPKDDEVVIQIEAAPINPSDLALLIGGIDISNAKQFGTQQSPVLTIEATENVMRAMKGRIGQSLSVGNEGAGIVVKTGNSPDAQALNGKTVAALGGGMYAHYRTVKVSQCLPLPETTSAREGAACFVNPLTALAMVETMRRENHTAIVHTVGSSSLGKMLNKVCLQDGIPLVNIVRKEEHVELLKNIGAEHVCNSSSSTFLNDLTEALSVTGATIAFDAIGGGRLTSQILGCMESVAVAKMKEFSRYGSDTFKQVYIYGMLDRSPTQIVRSFGFNWGINGWLLTPVLHKFGNDTTKQLRARVVAELKTTFATHYTQEISLSESLHLEVLNEYAKMSTGEKYLITPHK